MDLLELRIPLKRMYRASILLLFTLVMGTLGFWQIENYTPLDAVYMTVITMSTVGFGTVRELSAGGKVFSIALIIISASTFLYAITTITTFVVEGEVQQIFNRYRVNKKVATLRDHIIICGLGRNGREVAAELVRQDQTFVVIEQDQQVLDDFQEQYGIKILAIVGDASHEDVLEKANINDAKGLVSTVSSDAENVYISLTAREMCPHLEIVARASNESSISKLKRAGANKVILPNLIGGRKMANLITRPALTEFMDMVTGEGNPDIHLEMFLCIDQEKLIGQTLADLHVRARTGAVVIGYKRSDRNVELNPPVHRMIESEDRMFVLGTVAQIESFREMFMERKS